MRRFRGTEAAELEGFELLERVLSEQFEDLEDGEAPRVKEPHEIPCDNLRNPADPRSSYNAHRGQGYMVQVMEAYEEDDGEEARSGKLDRVVEAEANLPISRIFAERGEEGFRRLESAALGSRAERRDRLVIATGGGTVTLPANVECMRSSGTIFWLDPSFEAIVSRLGTAGRQRRPLFESSAQARALYEERRDRYSAAGLRMAIGTGEQPDEVAERIVLLLQADPAGRSQADRR